MAAASQLPYNPTRVFLAPNTSYAYIFQPSSQSLGQAELLTVDVATSISTSQLDLKTLSGSLPFLQDDVLAAYTPVIDGGGNILVSSGNCSEGANGTQLWHFAINGDSGNGSWTQWQSSNEEQTPQTSLGGSNFLSSGITFSEQIGGNGSNMSTFVFGGMCPWANSTSETWTSSAGYSNLMVTLAQDTTEDTEYDITLAMNRGPPIAEAGFSITPLPPTYAIDSEGSAQSQQQDFVFLGGHTQSAFINMSQVALYSLPQEAWTFLPVMQPSDDTSNGNQTQIEPRSGHTAVLSEDGSSVILFGGWVGDVTNAAEPQLAILEIGAGYGGTGSWTWSIPTQSSPAPGAPAGLYGHGATMLPGGVMMILGGYSIDTTSAKRSKRDAVPSQIYLYNTTSNAWIDSYTPPETFSEQFSKSSKSLSTKGEKIGLGVGLGIGLIILVILVGLLVWYSKRVKRAREAHDRALLSRSDDVSFNQADLPFLDGGVAQSENPASHPNTMARLWNTWDDRENAGTSRYPQISQMSEQATAAGATGLFIDIPSPTRGLRRGLANRPQYQYHAAPKYDDGRLSRTSGNIHPIAELENEDGVESTTAADETEMLSDAERKLRQLELVLSTPTDPFLDEQPKPLGSHPVSPEADNTVRRVPTNAGQASVSIPRKPVPIYDDSPNWIVEAGPGDYQEQDGRVSPTKSDGRTLSTLSDRSQRSILTNSSITRTMSTRTGALLAAALGNRNLVSPEHSTSSSSYGDSRTNTMSSSGQRSSFFLNVRASPTNGSSPRGPSSVVSDAESFSTARTNFAQLQSDGEALLGGRPPFDRDDPYQRAMAAQDSTPTTIPSLNRDSGISTMSSLSTQGQRRSSLMGSLRRALLGERSMSLTSKVHEQYYEGPDTSAPSPMLERRRLAGTTPRRAVSDGGALLRQKRGQEDWRRDQQQYPPYRDDPDAGDWGTARVSSDERGAEEEWDVESAAERREVQVMFTVPKARLRVVNADMDRASLRSASDGALSRTSSLRLAGVRREESIATLKARSEAERSLLDAHAEEEEDERRKAA
nr:hypothetical protein CFP56_52428 [Quercus suber]